MKTIEEMIAVMQAYKDGKKIETCQWRMIMMDPINKGEGEYFENPNPRWDWDDFDYRVKAEPKYRPYKSCKEFLRDCKKHGPALRAKNRDYFVVWNVLYEGPDSTVFVQLSGHGVMRAEEIYDSFTWQGGSPCGVKEE